MLPSDAPKSSLCVGNSAFSVKKNRYKPMARNSVFPGNERIWFGDRSLALPCVSRLSIVLLVAYLGGGNHRHSDSLVNLWFLGFHIDA